MCTYSFTPNYIPITSIHLFKVSYTKQFLQEALLKLECYTNSGDQHEPKRKIPKHFGSPTFDIVGIKKLQKTAFPAASRKVFLTLAQSETSLFDHIHIIAIPQRLIQHDWIKISFNK